jgi:hypothetical protein
MEGSIQPVLAHEIKLQGDQGRTSAVLAPHTTVVGRR